MLKHEANVHQGEYVKYRAKVTDSNGDCLITQVTEAVLIRRSNLRILNGKTEWHNLVYTVSKMTLTEDDVSLAPVMYEKYWGKRM